ncbi:hypothetical protein PAERUG_E16_London_17_VIM_2_04_14_00032 [Pseudomonas aeruginosa]|nr:hypothetical protein PAERUG_E16_London_17_VIM_2_04_14_00032 [Pseudomonas aeruginosa]
MGIADPAQAVALLVVLLVALAVFGDCANRAVVEDERDAAHLTAHARERPVARGGAAEHGAGHVGNVDAIGGQVVRPDQNFERIGIVDRAVDRHAADQRGHGDRTHERGVGRHGIDRLGTLAPGGAGARVGHGFRGGFERALRRAEARGEAHAAARATPPVAPLGGLCVVRLDPPHAALHACLVAALQPQAHGQVRMAAAAPADAVQTPLQVGEQPFGLLARAGRLLLVAAQVGPLGFERRVDALVDGVLALAQSLVLFTLRLVVRERGLKFGAQLLDLRNQRCHGVARGIALDAQRLHFIGRELGAVVRRGWRRAASTREQPDTDEQHQDGDRDHQPLE